MGLCVAGLALIGLFAVYYVYPMGDAHANAALASALHAFAVGASSIALFARIGGGIYTKAADVGADIAGKVVENIPEDDPRNPGVIADNVGDNVGDVAGMGADIYESLVAAVVATMAIALTAETPRSPRSWSTAASGERPRHRRGAAADPRRASASRSASWASSWPAPCATARRPPCCAPPWCSRRSSWWAPPPACCPCSASPRT
jgi:hypothetical protein